MRWKTLAVLALSLVIIGLDNTILNVALPTMQDEFDASPSKLQWMVDSYLLVFACLLIPIGTEARTGPRPVKLRFMASANPAAKSMMTR